MLTVHITCKRKCDEINIEINILRRHFDQFELLVRPEVIHTARLSRGRQNVCALN